MPLSKTTLKSVSETRLPCVIPQVANPTKTVYGIIYVEAQLYDGPKMLPRVHRGEAPRHSPQGSEWVDLVHGRVQLPYIKEDQEERFMVHAGKILGEIQLHDDRLRPSSGPEPMENLMEVDIGA